MIDISNTKIMKTNKIPNFFIVGAQKAGTTSLYEYLKEHPEIYMSPVKEPHYFAKDLDYENMRRDMKRTTIFIRTLEEYLELFNGVKNEKAIGEASPSYLYSKVAAYEIKKFNPDAKVIMILRDPVERAYSHYLMNLRDGLTSEKDFIKEVLSDLKKPKKGWGISHLYIELGLYYEQVKRYLDTFPKDNVKILLYEDFKLNTYEVIKDIFSFLGVENNFYSPKFEHIFMEGVTVKYPKLNKLLKMIYSDYKNYTDPHREWTR
ncbi:sulfotransferase [Thermodesulfovibrio sp. 3462-1]|uniref:Sulfotransferase n=1 Tax=Thermodesulfovibrio obliviosus TaxID=3118332 RepID=A0AAU8H2N0_9BACT